MSKKVAIIGSGVSSLASAVMLKEAGIDFVIYEKESQLGGKIKTEYINNFTIEAGPDSYLPEKFWSVQLIKKVGLEEEMLCSNDEHKGTFIYSNGKLHPLPEGVMLMVPTMIMPLLKSSLISWPGKIRMGLELFIPPKKDDSDESLAQFVTRRLGRECLEKIAEPLVAGIHTSNPDNMSVKATFPRFIEMEKKYGSLIKGMVQAMKNKPAPQQNAKKMTYFMSLKKGMEQLVEACKKFIGEDRIITNKQVVSITKDNAKFIIKTNDNFEDDYDYIIAGTPSYTTADIIKGFDPDLAKLLSRIEWSSSATISLAYKRDDINVDLKGFGFIVPKIENRRINACTWSSIKWSYRSPDDHILIRSFVGGGHHEELVNEGDEKLVDIVREELRDIVGIKAQPVLSKVYRWYNGMPKYTVGHLERIQEIDNYLKKHPGLYLIGCSYKGIGIGDCVKSGFDVASKIINNL
ncbi:MAG: protoporphyrinogen oxidase [Proteobacteria bacterium]|nr:protoporphyrinogen oxidase [Pseudomonadota bacterium]